jgi:hypothetical protein
MCITYEMKKKKLKTCILKTQIQIDIVKEVEAAYTDYAVAESES